MIASRIVAVLAAAALIGLAAPASAQQSAYTTLDLGKCRQDPINPNDPLQSGVWHCAGYAGIEVLVMEGDLRFFVSYGPDADTEFAAQQTLPPFNTIGDTLEWRLDAAGVPFATILRYFTDNGDGTERQVLVVTRIESPMCHIAYVDAGANPNANELARQAADLFARSFHCDFNSPLWIGEGGWFF
jgi:hypothetical protein